MFINIIIPAQLRRLDNGVDINRFTSDDDYKRDTIVGLAITTDAAVYAAAVRLAAHYSIPAWQVAFSHLTALFAEEDISTEDVIKRMEQHRLVDALLQEEPTVLAQKMVDVIYPGISGRNYARLRLFFDIFRSRPSLAPLLAAWDASASLDVLKRLQSVKIRCGRPVDFKQLVRCEQSFVQQIRSAVDGDNVNVFAKLTKLISSVSAGSMPQVAASTVYLVWAEKFFFLLADEHAGADAGADANAEAEADAGAGDRTSGPTPAEWLHRFESCKVYMNKMAAGDLLKLMDGLCFSDRALDDVPVAVRRDMCRRCLKLLDERQKRQHQQKNNRKEADPTTEGASRMLHIQSILERYCDHLERLNGDRCNELRRQTAAASIRRGDFDFWRQFERSRADESALHRLLVAVLMANQPIDSVRRFMSVFPATYSSTIEGVLIDSIRLLLRHLHGDANSTDTDADADTDTDTDTRIDQLLNGRDPFQVLADLLVRSDQLLIQPQVDELIRRFYEDDTVDVNVRLRILEMIPPSDSPSDSPSDGRRPAGSQLELLRTLALIQKAWVGDASVVARSRQLKESHVDSQEGRLALWNSLLDAGQDDTHLAALADLLHTWPTFTSR